MTILPLVLPSALPREPESLEKIVARFPESLEPVFTPTRMLLDIAEDRIPPTCMRRYVFDLEGVPPVRITSMIMGSGSCLMHSIGFGWGDEESARNKTAAELENFGRNFVTTHLGYAPKPPTHIQYGLASVVFFFDLSKPRDDPDNT